MDFGTFSQKKKTLIFVCLISQKKNNSNTLKTFLEEKIDKEGYKGKRMRRYQRFDCVRWWSLWIKRHEAVMRLRHRGDVFLTHYNWYSSSTPWLETCVYFTHGRSRQKERSSGSILHYSLFWTVRSIFLETFFEWVSSIV